MVIETERLYCIISGRRNTNLIACRSFGRNTEAD